MYKAIGEAAYNDGLFSQAEPWQKYQASVSQFGDGAIGAISRAMSGAGRATRDGSLGRTFLPAFGARAMRGLGHAYRDGSLGQAYRDGSLGDNVTVSLPGVSTSPSTPPPWKPDLVSAGLGVMAGALLFYGIKL